MRLSRPVDALVALGRLFRAGGTITVIETTARRTSTPTVPPHERRSPVRSSFKRGAAVTR